jgi:hypothetical protein
LKPAWTNSSQDPILKSPIIKNWAGGVAQGDSPEFKLKYLEKKMLLTFVLYTSQSELTVITASLFSLSKT